MDENIHVSKSWSNEETQPSNNSFVDSNSSQMKVVDCRPPKLNNSYSSYIDTQNAVDKEEGYCSTSLSTPRTPRPKNNPSMDKMSFTDQVEKDINYTYKSKDKVISRLNTCPNIKEESFAEKEEEDNNYSHNTKNIPSEEFRFNNNFPNFGQKSLVNKEDTNFSQNKTDVNCLNFVAQQNFAENKPEPSVFSTQKDIGCSNYVGQQNITDEKKDSNFFSNKNDNTCFNLIAQQNFADDRQDPNLCRNKKEAGCSANVNQQDLAGEDDSGFSQNTKDVGIKNLQSNINCRNYLEQHSYPRKEELTSQELMQYASAILADIPDFEDCTTSDSGTVACVSDSFKVANLFIA